MMTAFDGALTIAGLAATRVLPRIACGDAIFTDVGCTTGTKAVAVTAEDGVVATDVGTTTGKLAVETSGTCP